MLRRRRRDPSPEMVFRQAPKGGTRAGASGFPFEEHDEIAAVRVRFAEGRVRLSRSEAHLPDVG